MKGSRIGRSSFRRAPKPGKSIVRASALSQGDGELRLDGWILVGSYCSLERSDGLPWMALQQQRATKQMQRRRMLRNAGEHAAGSALSVISAPPVDGGPRPLQLCLDLGCTHG